MAKLTIPGRGSFEVDDSVLNLSEPELQAFAKDFAAKLDAEGDVSVFGDIATGVGAGGVGFVQGISELGASTADLAFDTDYSRSVTQTFEEFKEATGLVPQTTAGEVAEAITNFGVGIIPVLGWMSRANSAAKGTNLLAARGMLGKSAEAFGKRYKNVLTKVDETGTRVNRFAGQAGVGSLAAGAADFAVSPDGMHTLSDAFDAMPQGLRTIEDTGLEGREEAIRKLLNKLKVGAEGAAFTTAFELLGPTIKGASFVIGNTPGVPQIARNVSLGMETLGGAFESAFPKTAKKAKETLSTARGAPRAFYELTEDLGAQIDAPEAVGMKLFTDLDKSVRQTVASQGIYGKGKASRQDAFTAAIRFLEGEDDALKGYDPKVLSSATEMRKLITNLSEEIYGELDIAVKKGDLSAEELKPVLGAIKTQFNSYLRRMYEGPMNKSYSELTQGREKESYEAAVEEIYRAIRAEKTNAGIKVIDEELARQEARAFVDEQLGFPAGSLGEGGKPLSAIRVEEIADDATLLKRKLKEEAGSKERVPIYTLSDSILSSRSKRLEKAPSLRTLKRERTEGREALEHRYLRTIADMSRFRETSKFYRQVAEDDTMSSSMKSAVEAINSGMPGPMIIRPSTIEEGYGPQTIDDLMRLTDAGYTLLRDDNNKAIISKYGPLTGGLIRNDAYEAITATQRNPDGVLDSLWSMSLQAKGISQMGMTVLNPIGQIRNFLSNHFALMANGNMMNGADMVDSIRIAAGKAANLADDDFRKFYDLMGEQGLRDQSLTMNEYRLLLREGRGIDRLGASTTSEMVERAVRAVPGVKTAEAVYSGVDNVAKTVAFAGERGKYAAAFRKAGLNVDEAFKLVEGDSVLARDFVDQGIAVRPQSLSETDNFLNVMAGDIVKKTMPIYSRVPEVIKQIRRVPVIGNFVAFPAENIRNSTNILNQSLKEMGYKVGDELRKQIGNKAAAKLESQIRTIGARRAMGAYASISLVPSSIVAASKIASGMSDEDYQDFMNNEVPSYLRDHTLVILKDGPDKTEYIDLSYMMFYDYLKTPFKNAIREYNNKGEIGASEAEQIATSALAGLYGYLEPFASEAIVAERLIDATIRNGRTATGSPIYGTNDDLGEKAQKGFLHVLGGMEPAVLKMIAEVKSTGLEQGRLVRAFTGTPSATGMEYTMPEELLTLSSGLRKLETNKKQNLFYKGSEFSRNRSGSITEFTRFAKRNDVTQEQVEQQYIESMGDLFRAQQQIYKNISSYRRRGMSDNDIRRSLRESNIGKRDIGALMRGEFRPYRLSKQLNKFLVDEEDRQGLRRVLRRVDRSRMNNLYKELSGRSLDGPLGDIFDEQSSLQDIENTEEKRPLSSPVASSAVPMDTATGPEASFDMSSLSDFSVPQQPVQTADLQPIQPDASLLGDDPVTIARNMQIAQRTRRG